MSTIPRKKHSCFDPRFGRGYVNFLPSVELKSMVYVDGWFTAEQLRNIAKELDRLLAELKKEMEKNT